MRRSTHYTVVAVIAMMLLASNSQIARTRRRMRRAAALRRATQRATRTRSWLQCWTMPTPWWAASGRRSRRPAQVGSACGTGSQLETMELLYCVEF